jgi:hypothetical protein
MKRALAVMWLLAAAWSPAARAQEDPDHCAALQGAARCLPGVDEHDLRYVFVLPASWNGELVIYSKPSGAVLSGDAVYRPFITFRDVLVREGYAFGYLDFVDAPDIDYKLTSQQTGKLVHRFARVARKPVRTYPVGESRGGVLSLDLVESEPHRYDGALAECAPALGFVSSTKWRLDVRVLFDYFFTLDRVYQAGIPPILETPLDSNGSMYVSALYGLLRSADGPETAAEIAKVMGFPTFPSWLRAGGMEGQPEACTTGEAALLNSIVSPILFLMNQDRGLLAEDPVRSPYDNMKTVYAGSHDDAGLNAGVERLHGDRKAMNQLAKYYTPTGRLKVPVLSLYNSFDPLGVRRMQEGYADLVGDTGHAGFLALWSVERNSHCYFTPEERLEAFRALVQWVKGGAKPASGSAPVPGVACPR